MKNTKNTFTVLCKAIKNMKSEMYALVNPVTAALEEFTKNTYFKMLCTVVQYDNDPSEMQNLFLNRILKGLGLEEPLTEYMRRALELSEQDFKDFVDAMKEGEAKYYFALEAILVAQLGNQEATMDYVAELLEVCHITKQDVEYISLVAKSILKQDAADYDAAESLVSDAMLAVNFQPYLENYYVGAIIDREHEKCYVAPSLDVPTEIEFPVEYAEKNVSFENLHIHLTEEWTFEGCEEVIFINCKFTQENDSYFDFDSVGSVVIIDCEYKDFTNSVAYFEKVGNIIIITSYFDNCGDTSENDIRGGVFSGEANESFIFKDNTVQNCYIERPNRKNNYWATGVLIDGSKFRRIECINNTFIGCKCINNGDYNDSIIGGVSCINVSENNVCKGGVTRMFERV